MLWSSSRRSCVYRTHLQHTILRVAQEKIDTDNNVEVDMLTTTKYPKGGELESSIEEQ